MNSWPGKVVFLTAIISLAAILVVKLSPPIPISSVVTQKQDLFMVSGQGKVTVVPDTGIVSLGLNLTKPTVKLAQTEVNTIINKITTDVKQLGVDQKDIKTTDYSIYPDYDYRTGSGKITGYRVSASISVRVRDLEKINSVIDTATADGANTVGGVTLTVDEDKQKELVQEAREKAVAEAKTKAESLARAAGITLGRIINVQESDGYQVPRPVSFLKALDSTGAGGAPETSIEPGSTDITSSVTLYYETR